MAWMKSLKKGKFSRWCIRSTRYEVAVVCHRGSTREEPAEVLRLVWQGTCARRVRLPDMWKPYLNVIAKHAPNALNILDRYHIAAKMNKAMMRFARRKHTL
jgi:hypothetical protein